MSKSIRKGIWFLAILAILTICIYALSYCANDGEDWVLVRQLKSDMNRDGVMEIIELKVIGLYEKDGKLAMEDDHQTWRVTVKNGHEIELYHAETRGYLDIFIARPLSDENPILVMIIDNDVDAIIYTFEYVMQDNAYRKSIVASYLKEPGAGANNLLDYRWYPQGNK